MAFCPSVEHCSSARDDAEKRDLLLLKKWKDFVIEEIGKGDGVLTGLEFDKGNPGAGIYNGLPVNPAVP